MTFGKIEVFLSTIIASSVLAGLVMFLRSRKNIRIDPGPGRTAAIGNSITAGAFVRMLDRALPERSFVNMGVVGSGTAAIKRSLQRDVIGQEYDEVIIEGGANDLGRTDAVSYITSNLAEMVRLSKNSGLKVILVTLTPYHREVNKISAINNIVLSQGHDWGADVVIDIHSPIADSNKHLRADLVGDQMGIHPNRTGHQLISQAILETAYK
jgi:lysophospholipase L1-like esterase